MSTFLLDTPEITTVSADSIVRVSHSIRPDYPDFVWKREHEELEKSGPTEYDIRKIELWLHEAQKNDGKFKGKVIYEQIKTSGILESCISYHDLLAIKQKGVGLYNRYFGGMSLVAWKSVAQHVRFQPLIVPFLFEKESELAIQWDYLGQDWHRRSVRPAGRLIG